MLKVLLFLICSSAIAGDFKQHVKIENTDKDFPSLYSGTIFNKDDEYLYILTCAHGTSDIPEDKIELKATLFSNDYSVAIAAEIIKEDKELDLSLLRIKRYKTMFVWPIPVGKENLTKGAICTISGYGSGEFKEKTVVCNSYDIAARVGGGKLLVCDGKVEFGMSGCALIHKGRIVGVLSSNLGKIGPPTPFVTDGGMYVTGNDIRNFLEGEL